MVVVVLDCDFIRSRLAHMHLVNVVVPILPLVAVAMVVVPPERTALAERPKNQTRRVGEHDHVGVSGERFDRPGERGLHCVADQEDDIGVRDRHRVRGVHVERMRRRGAPDDEVRLAHARHHGTYQRMHRLDRDNDPQVVVGQRRAGGGTREERCRGERERQASQHRHHRQTNHCQTSADRATIATMVVDLYTSLSGPLI